MLGRHTTDSSRTKSNGGFIVNQFGYPESDWKLYKSKVADWQEGYMAKLCKEYIALLSSDKLPSHRFWELEKRIREDKRAMGVVVTNSRSKMIDNILDLLHEGAITLDDLSDFSEELKERIKFIYSGGYNNPDNRNRL